jgi:molybdenum cofactor cytidylyltransferase
MISGLVLAAGTSSRMGRPKQLLPYRGTTLLGAVLALATGVLDRVLVVLGAAHERILAQVDLHGADYVVHAGFQEGQASSLRAGLRALAQQSDVSACIVMLGDQPTVRREALIALCQQHVSQPDTATLVPRYGTRTGNPVLFARSAWPILEKHLAGDSGARALIARGEPAPLAYLDLPDVWWPDDIDTWDDYQRASG